MDFYTAKKSVHDKRTSIGQRWVWLLDSGHSPCRFFVETGCRNVAVALSARIDETILLIEDLRGCDVKIRYFADDFCKDTESFSEYGIDIVSTRDLPDGSVDFLITVTLEALRDCNALLNDMNTSIEAVSLDDLVRLEMDRQTRLVLYTSQLKVTGYRIFFLSGPIIRDFEDASLAMGVYTRQISRKECRDNPPHFLALYDDVPEYSMEYIKQIFADTTMIRENGMLRHVDQRSEFMNIVNGKRLTTDQPLTYDHTIHLFGTCIAFGHAADDRRTLASYLQRDVREIDSHSSWRVVNHGVAGNNLSFEGRGRMVQMMIESGEIKQGDVILDLSYLACHPHIGIRQKKFISCVRAYLKKDFGVDCIGLHNALYEAHRKEGVYIDFGHVNHRGYRAIARYVCDNVLKEIIENEQPATSVSPELPRQWGELLKNDRSPAEFFTGCGVGVALYTPGCHNQIIDVFESELRSHGITSQRIVSGDGIPEDTDFILDLSGEMDDDTARAFQERSGAEVIPLRGVLDIICDRVFLFEPLAVTSEGEYRVCVLGWACAKDLGGDPTRKYPSIEQLQSEPAQLLRFYEGVPEFSPAYIKELFTPRKIRKDSSPLAMENYKGKFLNVQVGARVTWNQPMKYDNTIHFFGGGAAYGVGVDDRCTIASHLQEHVNQYMSRFAGTKVFRVVNHGLWDGAEEIDILNQSLIPSFAGGHVLPGDVVLYILRTNFRVAAGKKQKKTVACIESYVRGLGLEYIDLVPMIRSVEKRAGAFVSDDVVSPQCYKVVAANVYMDYVKQILDGTRPAPIRRQNSSPFLERNNQISGEFR